MIAFIFSKQKTHFSREYSSSDFQRGTFIITEKVRRRKNVNGKMQINIRNTFKKNYYIALGKKIIKIPDSAIVKKILRAAD